MAIRDDSKSIISSGQREIPPNTHHRCKTVEGGVTVSSQHSRDEPTDSAPSDLIKRVKDLDHEAWTRLVRVYGSLVWFWIRRSGLQTDDGNDVFQEVFFTVANQVQKIRNDGSFWAWLRAVTRSKIADHFRRVQRDLSAEGGNELLSQLAQPAFDESDEVMASEADELAGLRRRALDIVRSGFEAHTWEMFRLSAVQGIPTAQVAEEFGVSTSAVRLAKSRVLRRLRDELRGLEP